MIGNRYGRLVVQADAGIRGKKYDRYWECLCDCGQRTVVVGHSLKNGGTKSCGCARRETLQRILTTHGRSKNGKSRAYSVWKSMKQRCFDPNCESYSRYGARGITVCDRWLDFNNFLADMGEPPNSRSLDRIDNSKGYSPENCRWATFREQNRNRRSNTVLTVDGVSLCLIEWSERTGLKPATICRRLAAGWDVRSAIFRPLPTKGRWASSRSQWLGER